MKRKMKEMKLKKNTKKNLSKDQWKKEVPKKMNFLTRT